ncbi:MAG: ABC transporter ATP-binding protein [Thiocapsa sp.]|jgi:ABC-type iron transport system FetAB ATPase subunit|nr:ABC transporter ATP-binding protein [Thiocapsa sp.]MCG6895723.1 ABC transporter ATP-binding protein [Thiocapsa sp.]MCG6984070.1 ABC transporter ATP-binding protein [Thiocapsa sp.]
MSELRLDGIRSRALGPLELTLAAGELVFVSGPSGSGKSLLLRAIADLDPHAGEAWLGEEPRSSMPPAVWRRRVGLLPAEAFWWAETVGEHLPHDARGPGRGARSVSRLPPGRLGECVLPQHAAHTGTPRPAIAIPVTVTAWLERLGFESDVLGWSVARLSTGERQRLALVRLLAQSPDALLLDEPTANLDPINTDRVESLVQSYRHAHAAAVLWASHDPAQRTRLSGRSLVIRDGQLESEG